MIKEKLEQGIEFVKDHKKEIVIGGLVIAVGGLTFVVFKQKKGLKIANSEIARLTNEASRTAQLENEVAIIHAAMSEGMVQEAIATTTRKLNTRLDIISRFEGKTNLRQNELDKLNKALDEALIFKKRLDAFNELEKRYFIKE